MAHNFYAVKRGFDKQLNKEVYDIIESEWPKVKPLVIGYDNARYKGFDTEEEAKTWLSVVDRTDAEKRAKKTIDKAKEDLGIETQDTHAVADEYADALIKLIKEYKKLGWDKPSTIGNLVSVVVNEVDKLY